HTAFYTLSLHDALPISRGVAGGRACAGAGGAARRARAAGAAGIAARGAAARHQRQDRDAMKSLGHVFPRGRATGAIIAQPFANADRKSTRLNSSHVSIS